MSMKLLILTQVVDTEHSNLGFFHAWIEEFAKYYELVTVVCLQEGKHDLPKNVRVFSLGKEQGTSKFTRVARFYKYILAERDKYDRVFVHMNPEYVILGGLFWRLLRKRVALWYTHKQVDLKLRLAEKLANVIFTASKESFRLASSKVRVVGHGIDAEHFCPGASLGKLVVTAGRISRSKHIEDMISMISPEELVVAGAPITDADREYMKTLVGKAKFLGPIAYEHMPDFYRSARLFLNASSTGSIDKAVLEAIACGVPVQTSNEAFRDLPKDNMRDWLLQNHSLAKLIPKIVGMLN